MIDDKNDKLAFYKEKIRNRLKVFRAGQSTPPAQEADKIDPELIGVTDEDIKEDVEKLKKEKEAIVVQEKPKSDWEIKWEKEKAEREAEWDKRKKAREQEEAEHNAKEAEKVNASYVLTEDDIAKLKARPPKAQAFVKYILANLEKTDAGGKLGQALIGDKHLIEAIEDMIGRDFYKPKTYYPNYGYGGGYGGTKYSSYSGQKYNYNTKSYESDLEAPPKHHQSRLGFEEEPRYHYRDENMYWKQKSKEHNYTPETELGRKILDLAKKGKFKELKAISDNPEVSTFAYNDINYRDANGKTALIWAAATNRAEILNLLLGMGAAPNLVDHDGATALSKACSRNNLKTVKELLDFDANPNLGEGDEVPLFLAIDNNNPRMVQTLLLHEADPNVEEIGNGGVYLTPLWKACLKKNIAIIELLLAFKAEPYPDLFKLPLSPQIEDAFKKYEKGIPMDEDDVKLSSEQEQQKKANELILKGKKDEVEFID
jgi:hypothetical protein